MQENLWNRFEVFSTTDDDNDDDNDSKLAKSDNIITEAFLRNDDVRKRKKIQKSCITSKNKNITQEEWHTNRP